MQNPPVILLGLEVNGLTVCRALGKKGIRLIGIDPSPDCIGKTSRYLTSSFCVEFNEPSLLHFLCPDEIRFDSKPLLFPTTDQTVEFIARNCIKLRERYTLGFSNSNQILNLLDKKKFKEIALQYDLRIPFGKSYFKGDVVDLKEFDTYPVIAKTHKKFYGKANGLPKAIIAYSEPEAKAWIEKYLEIAGECLVEEFVDGADDSVFFVFVYCNNNGEAILSYCGKKIRQWPVLTGGTASAMPWINQKLVEQTERFFEKAGFTGLASMEYKYDTYRDDFIAIEPTVGRIDFQEGLAIGNGVNFPFRLYTDIFGLDHLFEMKQVQRKEWICFDADYNAVSQIYSNNFKALFKWFLKFFKKRIYSVFDLTDLKPFLIWFTKRFIIGRFTNN